MANDVGTRKRAKGKPQPAAPLPDVIEPTVDAPRLKTQHGSFDLDDAILPQWVEERAFRSGDYPYDAPMKDRHYEDELEQLQVELVKLQAHVIKRGLRVVIIFEGRDGSGKGGAIGAFRENLNPRSARTVALTKPNEAERGQWYFQRYVAWLPTAGEIVLFDRAGVEPIMGFCTRAEQVSFLEAVPGFEKMLVDQSITLFKFYLDIGREMQLKRLYDRRHDPLKVWKLSPVDYVAMAKWGEYTRARDEMLIASHRPDAPWTVVKANDKRRARLNIIRRVLSASRYEGKDESVVRKPDPLILAEGPRIIRVEKKRAVAAAGAN